MAQVPGAEQEKAAHKDESPSPDGVNQKQESCKDAQQKDEEQPKKDGPAGGYDGTQMPTLKPGVTLKITIHRATSLPMADLTSLSSDPYVLGQLNFTAPTRNKEDPPLCFRTPTVRQNTDPVWNEDWIIANVPSSAKFKFRIYDEDPADKDDRLGNVHVNLPRLTQDWKGFREQPFEIKVRSGSKRAYAIRSVAACFNRTKHIRGHLYLSIENLGPTENPEEHSLPYTVGPCRWIRHYDPILGRMVGMKDSDDEDDAQGTAQQSGVNGRQDSQQKKVKHYNFQANQIQLQGPVPPELYHRFVEFKPFVKRMFTSSGIQGWILSKALHHQHNRVYSFDGKTEWGHIKDGPNIELTKKFLELVRYDQGGRIFTYVLTLDALWRFTETGKEFGIDLLSKHTMHSDVSIYIAFSGEFFVRRLKHARRPPPPEPIQESSQTHPPDHKRNETHPPADINGGPPEDDPPKDPAYYELIIDNDSGTYRPNAKLLPLLKEYLTRTLPGIHILTLDCQADEEKMNKMKDEQRDRKKREGERIVYTQGSRSSSISSSDEEDLDRVQAGMDQASNTHKHKELVGQAARDQKLKHAARLEKVKGYGGKARPGFGGDAAADEEGGNAGQEAEEATSGAAGESAGANSQS